ncbi:hypothetical protein HOP50_13g68690 [Chloropicon primus]|uniref:Uncharacterized protein n=1 Tax=Chloropicon primus TaxID=1764295 RepID=A0A5B8MVG4_9CHLO|nr:hypothetical protein A3770_13p68490 [Chloropicon primus]UPR03539.1 hypothetical protein HOP50_13g68690 [Chloropicon primus]|mmetsp:Transcript_5785/g.17486  ORF Transcript_5785/g.17486 Transcript_5785/m.17486 type:complete len:149 (-) Transcript_5785:919-1365(-)|eukprot:QDZ24331.1 hypothetical protein A3770_13p68490 [Chloropicon primus]
MRVFYVLRDLYRRLFVSSAKASRPAAGYTSELSSPEAVRDALRAKLALRNQLRVLKERARETEEERKARELREEKAMLEELKKTREKFGQQMEFIKRERERNETMIEERLKAKNAKHGTTQEEKIKRVFEEIEKFEKDFFAAEEPSKK